MSDMEVTGQVGEMLFRSARGRLLNAPAVFIHPRQQIVVDAT
jgi:hypothetical protein